MKKSVGLLAVLILLMNMAVPVFADTVTTPATVTTAPTVTTGSSTTTSGTAGVGTPGILPDSPFYVFDQVWERIVLFFTFSPENKAQELLQDANQRLAAAQVMADEGKQDLAIQSSQAYLDTIQQAQVQIIIASGDSKVSGAVYNTVTSAVYGLKDHSLVAVVYGLDISQRHAAQVLLRVLAKAPEQARKGLMNAFANVVKHQMDDEAMIYVTTGGKTASLAAYNNDHPLQTAMNSLAAQLLAPGSKPKQQGRGEEHGKNPSHGLSEMANAAGNRGMNAQSPMLQPGLGKLGENNTERNSAKNREQNNAFNAWQPGSSSTPATVTPAAGSWPPENRGGIGKNMMQHGRPAGGQRNG